MVAEASPGGGFSRDVRAVAAYGTPGGTTLTFPARPLDDSSWAGLIPEAKSERVLGLMLDAATTGAFPVTAGQLDQTRALATEAVGLCLALEGELLRVHTLLRTAGVTLRVLKGPAAAALDYPDPTMRSFVDIDVLVRSVDFDRAATTLVAAGYVREHPQPRSGFDRRFSKGTSFVAPSGLSLDLHRTFVMGPFGLSVDLDDLWASSESFTVGARTFDALSAECRLLHASYHAALGDWPKRLVPHRDIAQTALSDSCDTERVLDLARRWRAEAVLATGVSAAWELLGVAHDTPLSSWARQFVPSAADQRALDLYAGPGHSYAALSVAALRAIPGVRAKAAFLRALTFPEQSYLTGRHRSRAARIVSGVRQAMPFVRRGG